MSAAKKKCEICFENENKYKCPKCFVLYCSLNCYKTHKEKCSLIEPQEEVKPTQESDLIIPPVDNSSAQSNVVTVNKRNETELVDIKSDFVPLERLKLLGESDQLKQILSNKHLRELLVNLNSSDKKDQEIERLMQEPLFQEFSDSCLKIVQNNKDLDDSKLKFN